jgi:hypothetical protein
MRYRRIRPVKWRQSRPQGMTQRADDSRRAAGAGTMLQLGVRPADPGPAPEHAAARVGGRRYPRHSPVDGQRQCGNMRNATDARLLTSAPLSAADSQGAEGGDHRFFR